MNGLAATPASRDTQALVLVPYPGFSWCLSRGQDALCTFRIQPITAIDFFRETVAAAGAQRGGQWAK